MKKPLFIIFLILLIDQVIKMYVKTTMMEGDSFPVFKNMDWFNIHFIENPGMAFGLELGGSTGKYVLSIFRIIAASAIMYYLWLQVKQKVHQGIIISMALIFAGAFGNIIDSAFYGLIFNDSTFQVATLFPKDGGYAGFLQGRVVDMFYFPIVQGQFPAWIPQWGGQDFIFFRPIFNFADASITVGVVLFIIFQQRVQKKKEMADASLNQAIENTEGSINNTDVSAPPPSN